MKYLSSLLLTMGFGIAVNGQVQAQVNAPTASVRSKDPIELCKKLAGAEREICLRQARENPGGAAGGGIGATPGTGSTGSRAPGAAGAKREEDKRGNTRPGMSRGGDAPASGAIVDPAGVTRR